MEMSLSPLPDIGEVTGEALWYDEQGIDADVVALSSVARCEPLCGDRDASKPIFVESPCGCLHRSALLDFDEGNDAAAARDKVYFAAGHAGAPGKDPPALQLQPPGGDSLRSTASSFGELAI